MGRKHLDLSSGDSGFQSLECFMSNIFFLDHGDLEGSSEETDPMVKHSVGNGLHCFQASWAYQK